MVCDEFPTVSPGSIICIGHGIAGGKWSGLDQTHPYHRKENGRLITYTVTSSPDMVRTVAKYSGVPEETVLPLGMPRTDAYVGKAKGDGHTVLSGKRAYLYVPTYRTKEEPPLPRIDWRGLDNALTDDEVFAVKPHMMTGRILPAGTWRHIIELSNSEPSAPYLYDADVVITDYSTIMFDAYLLGKPVVLFDRNTEYLTARGMYLEYPDEYSSRHCGSTAALIDMMKSAHDLTETERECIRKVAASCDGHSTERVCELIRRTLHENLSGSAHI